MADYIIHYSDTTGRIIGMWPMSATSNILTAVADNELTIDGVNVILGIGTRTDLQFAQISDPADVETTLLTNVLEVDNMNSPTDVAFRTDENRNPEYEFSEE